MKYLLLIYHDEQAFLALSEEQRQSMYKEYRQFREEIVATGNFIAGSQLNPTATAKSVRVRNGKPLTIDGPFAETKEQLGGYFLVETETTEQALRLASRIPSAKTGTVEVRALT